MTHQWFLAKALLIAAMTWAWIPVSWAGESAGATPADLARQFAAPPDSAKPSCFWMWFNNLMNKEGISRDLEEAKAKGMGGVTIFCMAASPEGVPQGPEFLSAGWRELYQFALAEADRLGLEVGVNICYVWDMGGPWITPEHAGRWFLQSETNVVGPRKFSGRLPLPGPADGYDTQKGPMRGLFKIPFDKIDYRDSAVIAFREPEAGARFDEKRKQSLAAKSIRRDASCFIKARSVMDPTLVEWKKEPSDCPIRPEEVIELTSKLAPDGTLEWDVPEGSWTILRTGHRMIEIKRSGGLEVDWLSKAAVDLHWDHLVKVLLADAGPLAGKTFKYIQTDSFEDGYPNWTSKLLDEFKRYRGYEATPYLPVLAGRIVGSAEISDRFLHDYRKTVADCMADNNYGYLGQRAREHGLKLQCEAAGPSWSGTVCLDALKNLGRCELPTGEFWTDIFTENGGTPAAPMMQNKVGKQTATAAHVYGRRTASAEAFTSLSFPSWSETPAFLKPFADRAFCEGINRMVFSTMTGSRPKDGLPGYEYGAGTHFNPNVTWWNQAAGSWIGYINRCQALLQSGLFVADVLYYNGDWAPNLVEPKHLDSSLGQGYDYDVCNAEALLTRLSVKDGKIVLPDGMSYRLLVLPNTTRMPVEVAQKIKALVQAGATVVGSKPESDPGLKNYPQCDVEVKAVAAELWGDLDGERTTERKYGQGRVVWGKSLREVLTADGVSPDFTYTGEGAFIDFIHRNSDGAGIYFLANRNDRAESVDCRFRVSGKQPELWNPVTGERRDLPVFEQKNGCTSVPLQFEPNGSAFVVFRRRAEGSLECGGSTPLSVARLDATQQDQGRVKTRPDKAVSSDRTPKKNFAVLKQVQEIAGPWQVTFDAKWLYPEVGTPLRGVRGRLGEPSLPTDGRRSGEPSLPEEYREVTFEQLEDWTARPELGIKYYSGTATYRKTFELAEPLQCGPTYLDLGVVPNGTARVWLNGQDCGVVWCAPWRVPINSAVKPGANVLEIEVVNLWPNRLIGDGKLPPEKRLTRTNIEFYNRPPRKGGEHKLLESGLLGPVRVTAGE